MLNEELIEKVVARLVRRIEQGNEYVLMEIGKSIKKLGKLTPSKAQQLVQVMKYGGDYDKIVKKLKKITKLNEQDIYKIFDEVAKHDYKFAKQFYDYRGVKYIPYNENKALQDQIHAIAEMTAREYVNLANTSAFATIRDNKIVYTDLATTYQNVMDEAIINVGQGKETFDTAMHRTLKQLGESGVRTVDYASGRSIRMDSAVRMNLKGGLTRMHDEMQQQIGKEFDADGVEISVHEFPAPDHEDAQGKQFTNKEYDNLQINGEAVTYDGIEIDLHPTLASGDSADYFRQIGVLNCYHYIFAIVLGVSQQSYTNEELQEIKDRNQKGFEYNGRHYTMYEGTQLQRQLETRTREWKDIQILAKASDNEQLIQQSQAEITRLNTQYKELSNISGLPTKMERLRVGGYKRTDVSGYNAPKVVKTDNAMLQENTEYGSLLIPKDAEMENVVVLAGYETNTPIKTIRKLTKDHPNLPQKWQKKAGMVKGKYGSYEIHWYENEGQQYYHKAKVKGGKK